MQILLYVEKAFNVNKKLIIFKFNQFHYLSSMPYSE